MREIDRVAWPRIGRGDCNSKMVDDDWCTDVTVTVYTNGMSYTFCSKHVELWKETHEQVKAEGNCG